MKNDKSIRELAMELTIQMVNICDKIKGREIFTNQLLRAVSSIGANMSEAKYAQSDQDFVHKAEIALKECYESEYWLEILTRIGALTEEEQKEVKSACGTIRSKLIASIKTVKTHK